MRDWIGRVVVGGTVLMIVGGLWSYASIRRSLLPDRRVYFPALPPLPEPPPDHDVWLTQTTDTAGIETHD